MADAEPKRHLADRLADYARPPDVPGQLDAPARVFFRLVGPLLRLLFRPSISGWEHLPADRPFLVVSNHSGGGASECLCLIWLWRKRFGDARPIAGMAVPPVFLIPPLGGMLRGVGAVPATYRHAEAAFAAGASVIVFPGGDYDAFRPIWQANLVDFNGRKGYLRLARKVGVPIVPLGIQGSHYTAPVLWRSTLLPKLLVAPRLLAAKRLPVTLLGVVGVALIYAFLGPAWGTLNATALAALWLIVPIHIFCPIVPWTISARLGPAIEPGELFGEGDEREVLEAANTRVIGEIQRLVLGN